jgi:hypothetical protein
MQTYKIPNAIFKIGGATSILAGILMMAGFILHPAGEDATFGTDPFWVPAHVLLWIAFTIALLGWIGLYVVQASTAGWLGIAAFVILILGSSLASWIFSSYVTFVPVIAAKSPALFKSIFTRSHIALGIASVLTWVLGNVLFGFSIIRAKIFPRWAGILLIFGTVIIPIAYLAGFSVRVVSVGAIIAGAGQVWLGYELLRMVPNLESQLERLL